MQDLNELLFFAEVVDHGSFAAAARALGLPKSRLSRRVAELEARLGVRLLQRTTRKLSLTEAGEQCHRHCAAMREQAEAALQAVALVQSEPRGTLRVACPVTLAQTMLGRLLPLFMERHPQVRVDLRVSNRVVDLVEEGVDVALRVRATLEDSGSLVVKQLGLTHALLVASPAQLRRQGTPEHPDALVRMDTVAMSAVEGRSSWQLLDPAQRLVTLTHQPRLVADDLWTLKLAILRGTGVGLVPDYLCQEELAQGRLVALLPGWAPAPAILHAVFPSRRGLAPATRRFLDFLGEQVSGITPHPDWLGDDPGAMI